MVIDIFEQRDGDIILNIPLDEEVKDNWYWRNDKLGSYSVKGGYLFLQEEKQGAPGDINSGFWRNLWNLKIPPKVKNFLWRASNNCLPTKDMLRSKHVHADGWCPTCNASPETVLHSIVTCSFAQQCWNSAALSVITGTPLTFYDWIQMVFDQRSRSEVQATTMIGWMIWKNRNEVVWKQKCMDFSNVVTTTLSVLNQWKFFQDKTFNISMGYMTQEDGLEQWQAPTVDRVKVNSDAALFENPDRYSHAFIVRDHGGILIEARSRCCQGLVTPVLAEAMGVREALSWVKSKKQHNVDVEFDSLELVQWIRSSYTSLSYVGRIVDECRKLLAGVKSQNVMLRFVKRSANRLAHYLARYNYLPADRVWRMENVHREFYHVLCNDLRK